MDHLELRAHMAPELPARLLAHIDRVVELAAELARLHGADLPRTLLAAQGHDLLRAWRKRELLAEAERRGLDIDPVDRVRPVLLHGPLGALHLEERFGIHDTAVLDAVRWHTFGDAGFGIEAWAVFVADKAEPAKLARTPALQRVLDLARGSTLRAAALAYLELNAEQAAREGWPLHPRALATAAALREGPRAG